MERVFSAPRYLAPRRRRSSLTIKDDFFRHAHNSKDFSRSRDIAFNYKTGSVLEQLQLEAPTGIDVYFDNVGGETLEAALSVLRIQGRILDCGGISGYNAEKPQPGPSNLSAIVTKRLTMKGMIVSDFLNRRTEFEKEVGGYYRAGKLKNKETIVEGLELSVGAFIGLFHGQNVGKMVVKLA